jgi:hypothetical protein
VLGALFVARFLWPEFSHASPSRLQTESADRYFELSPAPLCAEGVCHGGRVRGWYGDGRARRLPRAKIKIKPFRHVERDRPGGGAAAAGRASRLRRPRHASRASRRRGYPSRAARYASRVTQRPSYHVVRGDGLYSSQRRINYKRRTTGFRRIPGATRAPHSLGCLLVPNALVSLSESFTDTPMRIRVLAFRERDVETAAFCATFWPCSRLMPFASTAYAVDVASARRLF